MRYCYTVVITLNSSLHGKKILDEKPNERRRREKNNLLPSSAKVWCSMNVVVDESLKKIEIWLENYYFNTSSTYLCEVGRERKRKIIFNRSNFFRHVVALHALSSFLVWKIVIHFAEKRELRENFLWTLLGSMNVCVIDFAKLIHIMR